MFVFSVLAEYSIILTITGKIRKRKLREEQVMNSLQNIFTEILIPTFAMAQIFHQL